MPEQEQYPILLRKENGTPPKVRRLSKREYDMIEKYIQTGSFKTVAQELHFNVATVREFLQQEEIKLYITEKFKYAASMVDLTPEKITSKINEVIDDPTLAKTLDKNYFRVLELGARVCKMVQGTTVNVGVQVSENPFSTINDAELDKMIKERLNATQRTAITISSD